MQLSGKKPLCTLANSRAILGPHAQASRISLALHNSLSLHVAVNNYFRHCLGEDKVGPFWDFEMKDPAPAPIPAPAPAPPLLVGASSGNAPPHDPATKDAPPKLAHQFPLRLPIKAWPLDIVAKVLA